MGAIVFIILQIFFATRTVLKIGKYLKLFQLLIQFSPLLGYAYDCYQKERALCDLRQYMRS